MPAPPAVNLTLVTPPLRDSAPYGYADESER